MLARRAEREDVDAHGERQPHLGLVQVWRVLPLRPEAKRGGGEGTEALRRQAPARLAAADRVDHGVRQLDQRRAGLLELDTLPLLVQQRFVAPVLRYVATATFSIAVRSTRAAVASRVGHSSAAAAAGFIPDSWRSA